MDECEWQGAHAGEIDWLTRNGTDVALGSVESSMESGFNWGPFRMNRQQGGCHTRERDALWGFVSLISTEPGVRDEWQLLYRGDLELQSVPDEGRQGAP